jgi:hypothetical protein
MKPIKIDWDALDEAFHNQNDELVYYLDLVTGHVVLEGEGEDDDDYYPDDNDTSHPVVPAPTTSGAGTRAYVEPPGTERKLEWMRRFLAEVDDLQAESVDALKRALAAEDPAEALRGQINHDAEARDRWYLYRADRIHEFIEEWLAREGVATVGDPPWR